MPFFVYLTTPSVLRFQTAMDETMVTGPWRGAEEERIDSCSSLNTLVLFVLKWRKKSARKALGWPVFGPRFKPIYLLTYLLTPWCRVLLEKLTGLQLVKKFPAFHGTRRFITALTSVHHLPVSWASPIQSIYPHPTSWRSVLIGLHQYQASTRTGAVLTE